MTTHDQIAADCTVQEQTDEQRIASYPWRDLRSTDEILCDALIDAGFNPFGGETRAEFEERLLAKGTAELLATV
jgi:hypothetical protein